MLLHSVWIGQQDKPYFDTLHSNGCNLRIIELSAYKVDFKKIKNSWKLESEVVQEHLIQKEEHKKTEYSRSTT